MRAWNTTWMLSERHCTTCSLDGPNRPIPFLFLYVSYLYQFNRTDFVRFYYESPLVLSLQPDQHTNVIAQEKPTGAYVGAPESVFVHLSILGIGSTGRRVLILSQVAKKSYLLGTCDTPNRRKFAGGRDC